MSGIVVLLTDCLIVQMIVRSDFILPNIEGLRAKYKTNKRAIEIRFPDGIGKLTFDIRGI